MKTNEALERCLLVKDKLSNGTPVMVHTTDNNISWLNECIEALEKHIPKKPITRLKDYEGGFIRYDYCPSCGMYREARYDSCPKCGQAIDWSEEE